MTIKWATVTPDNFRFTAKFPKELTHEKKLAATPSELEFFFESMRPLKDKLLALLIQIPSSITAKEGLKKLQTIFLPSLDSDFRYAIEFLHNSWFSDDVYKVLKKHNICMVWNQVDLISVPAELTTDFFYLRLVGDKSMEEKDLGAVRKDRTKEMQKWAMKLSGLSDNKIRFGVVAASNHYAGFGPDTASEFKRMLGD